MKKSDVVKVVVKWRDGTRIKTPADVAYKEMERIREKAGGNLEAADIVKQSKPADAPLHGEFEWSNAKAANEYRLQQAKFLVRKIEVITEEAGTEARAYESVYATVVDSSGDKEVKKTFRRIQDIMQVPSERDELLGQAIRDAIAFKRRYHALSELAKVFSALDDFTQQVGNKL